jgi:hypothetical protein
MSIIKQKPATEIEERTHFVSILSPKVGFTGLEILREEVDTTTGASKNLGVAKKISWAELSTTPQFAYFKATLGFSENAVFFAALRDLFDNICDPDYGSEP